MANRRIGFILSVKKRKKINLEAFADLCRHRRIEVIEAPVVSYTERKPWQSKSDMKSKFHVTLIDLNQPMASQGPFDVIVHKLSDVIVEAEHDSQSQSLLANFQAYLMLNPQTIILDPLPAMTKLLDRFASYCIMNTLQNSMAEICICTPPYLEISTCDQSAIRETVDRKQLTYPLICKTRVAHGSRSHEMSLIFSADGLKDARPPCVLQSFVNHGAVLHKVFVVGEEHFIVERPSLKDFPPGPCDRKTIFFNSHEVSKPESCSHLTALDENTPRMPPPSRGIMAALVCRLRAELGMALFGVDVIVDSQTRTLTVIDINIFPGYEGAPQFFSSLLRHIESVLEKRWSPK